jgi:phosphonate transport system permease protein
MSTAERAALEARFPRVFRRTARQRARLALVWLVLVGLLALGLWRIDADPVRIWNGLSKLGFMVGLMLPPSTGGALPDLLAALAETLAMAFLGTLLAATAALPLGFLGARNVIPPGLFHFGLRRVFDGLRGIDTLIWALIFVAAVGLGPFAGILAIAVPDAGTLAKLFAEAIENAERREAEGVRATGAGATLVGRFGILPQVLPVMLSHVLYFFESNTRSAAILGVVGAGGIGLALSDRLRINDFDEAAFIILMILVTVAVIDTASAAIRRRLILA